MFAVTRSPLEGTGQCGAQMAVEVSGCCQQQAASWMSSLLTILSSLPATQTSRCGQGVSMNDQQQQLCPELPQIWQKHVQQQVQSGKQTARQPKHARYSYCADSTSCNPAALGTSHHDPCQWHAQARPLGHSTLLQHQSAQSHVAAACLQVFDDVAWPAIEPVLQGISGTVFAYGVTSRCERY